MYFVGLSKGVITVPLRIVCFQKSSLRVSGVLAIRVFTWTFVGVYLL